MPDAPLCRSRRPDSPGSTVFGVPGTDSPECAALANGTAVRQLDFHDTFLAAEYSHPGDNIPPILATAQHKGLSGAELVRRILTGHDNHADLANGICLHDHKIDHVAHHAPTVAARLGSLPPPAP